jgi:DNA (cytosine-5)-methyltransferase 1
MDGPGCTRCEEDAAFLRRSCAPRRPDPSRTIRAVDLFCGAGGLSLGFDEGCRRAGLGFEVALAIDSDSVAMSAFRANLPTLAWRDEPVEWTFDGQLGAPLTKVERRTRRAVGKVDVLLGGPPCQGVSSLNNHTRMDDPRNALYARMGRAAEVLRPDVVVVENVPGVAHDIAKVVADTVACLVSAGYQTRSFTIDLSSLGVPQHRKRLVIIGLKTPADHPVVLSGLGVGCTHIRTVRWAIEDLAAVRHVLPDEGPSPMDEPSRLSKRSRKRIEYLFRQDRYDLPNELRPPCHMKDHSYRSMYGRLQWDFPAQTITSGFASMGQGRFVHPSLPRTLTAHEAARLQTFPDFYTFPATATRTQLAQLIANAVPPLANAAIAHSVLGSMFGPESTTGTFDEAA